MSSPTGHSSVAKPRCFCPPWLIDAVYEVVHRSPVRVGEMVPDLVSATGQPISEDLLYMWATKPGNRSGKHRCAHLRWLVPLTQASENHHLIEQLLLQLGLQIPPPRTPRPDAITPEFLHQLTQSLHELAERIEDGDLQEADLTPLARAVRRLRHAMEFFDAVMAVRNGQKGDLR